jgi:hypothetical protein
MSKAIPLDKITADPEVQSRAVTQQQLVDEYAEALKDGAEFPPVTVVNDGETNWLPDGFHRLEAHRKAGKPKIEATVQKGTKRDAILIAVGANAEHGKRRSDEDKRHVVLRLLRDPTWVKRSDRWIANTCHVSNTFVGHLREMYVSTLTHDQPQTREVQRGGTVYEQRVKPRQPIGPEVKLSPARMVDEELSPERLTGVSPVVDKVKPEDELKPRGKKREPVDLVMLVGSWASQLEDLNKAMRQALPYREHGMSIPTVARRFRETAAETVKLLNELIAEPGKGQTR